MSGPLDLVLAAVITVQVAMVGLCLMVARWPSTVVRFEREVMVLATLATGPLGLLLMDAIPLDPPYMAAKITYLQLGMAGLCVQLLFWSAFLRLRKGHRAEQAALKASA